MAKTKNITLRQSLSDLQAATELSRFDVGYLPWTNAVPSATALVMMLNDMIVNQRRAVVEFGAGVSTVYLGQCARKYGGQVISFEHDATWVGVVQQMLAAHGLQDHVQLVLAPLENMTIEAVQGDWYSRTAIDAALGEGAIDLLFVDGPPAYAPGMGMARFPALPYLAGRMAENSSVFLDDLHRTGEQEILRRWDTLTGHAFRTFVGQGNHAWGVQGAFFNIA